MKSRTAGTGKPLPASTRQLGVSGSRSGREQVLQSQGQVPDRRLAEERMMVTRERPRGEPGGEGTLAQGGAPPLACWATSSSIPTRRSIKERRSAGGRTIEDELSDAARGLYSEFCQRSRGADDDGPDRIVRIGPVDQAQAIIVGAEHVLFRDFLKDLPLGRRDLIELAQIGRTAPSSLLGSPGWPASGCSRTAEWLTPQDACPPLPRGPHAPAWWKRERPSGRRIARLAPPCRTSA